MNKYLFTQFWSVSALSNQLLVDDNYGGSYVILNNNTECSDYGKKRVLARLKYYDKNVKAIIDEVVVPINVPDEIYLENELGEKIDISQYEVLAHLRSCRNSSRYTIFKERDVKYVGDNDIYVFDWENKTYRSKTLSKEYEYLSPYQMGDKCFCRNRSSIVCVDSNLDFVWEYKYQAGRPQVVTFSNELLDCGDLVIANIGGVRRKDLIFDGEIIALEKENGNLAWSRKFEYQVDSLKSIDDRYACALVANEIYIIDGFSGEVTHVISTGFKPMTRYGILHVDKQYIYLFANHVNTIQIFDKQTYEKVAEHSGRESLTPYRYEAKNVGDFVIIQLARNLYSSEMLVIDPRDLHAPIQEERLDEVSVKVPDTAEGPVVITIIDEDVSKVLRHGEVLALETADDQGYERRGLERNQLFDGEILLRYSGWQKHDEADIKIKLNRLKERIEAKIADNGILAGNKKGLCTFNYELI